MLIHEEIQQELLFYHGQWIKSLHPTIIATHPLTAAISVLAGSSKR
jgi:hypothetical protein